MSNLNDNYYKENYSKVLNEGSVGLVSALIHKLMEKPFLKTDYFHKILEVGAGNGQHFEAVKCGYDTYIESDIRLDNLPRRMNDKVIRAKVDAAKLENFKTNEIDRLISTCLLVHLPNPEDALKEWRRVTRGGGSSQSTFPVNLEYYFEV